MLTLTAYCTFVVVASLLGGWLPSILKPTHTRLQVMMSFVGGFMMAVAMLHLLPHAAASVESIDVAATCAVAGLVGMFLMMRMFHAHQHEHGPPAEHDNALDTHAACAHQGGHVEHVRPSEADSEAPPGREEGPAGHVHADGRSHKPPTVHSIATTQLPVAGMFIGMGLHTLIDGVALAASVAAATRHGETGLVGLGTFLAVLLHKPLDALSITSMMSFGKWPRPWIMAVNIAFALICPLGAILFLTGLEQSGEHSPLVGWALGFSAGVFLCISLADILPELQFHRHDRGKLTAAFLLGVAMAFAMGFIEPAHEHGGHGNHPGDSPQRQASER